MRATIELKGEQELIALLDRAAAGLAHPQPMLDQIGAQLEENVNLRFQLQEDPNGVSWPPLSPLTATFRQSAQGGKVDWKAVREAAKRGGSRSGPPATLIDRGWMQQSLKRNLGPDWVEVGMLRLTDNGRWNVPALHEFGTRSMPRRGLLAGNPTAQTLGAEDRQAVLEIAQRYLAGLV